MDELPKLGMVPDKSGESDREAASNEIGYAELQLVNLRRIMEKLCAVHEKREGSAVLLGQKCENGHSKNDSIPC